PRDTASNDILATHCAVRVGSLGATAAALARRGTPLADHDLMILRGAYAPPWYPDLTATASWWKSGPRPRRKGLHMAGGPAAAGPPDASGAVPPPAREERACGSLSATLVGTGSGAPGARGWRWVPWRCSR